MNSPYLHERRRIMGPGKKVKFCQLVRESHSLEEAAEWVDVSIRTVQRERKRDEDFDHEIRLALQATPDPLRLMENAARVHWRAAAWLLERTRPEQFARQPANTARDYQVEAALGMLLEAALAATAPAERAAFYQQVEPVCGQALQYCFPQLGPGGNLKKSKLPPTPLADDESNLALRAAFAAHQRQAEAAAENGEQPVEWFRAPGWFNEQPAPAGQLSPKTNEATVSDTTASDTTTGVGWVLAPTSPAHPPEAPSHADRPSPATAASSESKPIERETVQAGASTRPTEGVVSPKTDEATPSDTTPSDATTVAEEPVVAIDYNLPIDFNLSYEDFAQAIATLDPQEQRLLWDQRLRHRSAAKRRKERQAVKQQEAAKNRAQASRRRAA